MAKLDAKMAKTDFNAIGASFVNFDEIISTTARTLVWETTADEKGISRVHVVGSGITVDADGNITGGTITGIGIDRYADANFSGPPTLDMRITGISVSLLSLIASPNSFWAAALSGNDEFEIGPNARGNIFGDFSRVVARESSDVSMTGGNDRIEHFGIPKTTPIGSQYYPQRFVSGDAYEVKGSAKQTASLQGGADVLRLSGYIGTDASGDAINVEVRGILKGGNDTIVYSVLQSPTPVAAGKIVGDAINNSGTVTGGDDVLVQTRDNTYISGGLIGDVHDNKGTLIGGDDTLRGNDFMSGDAYHNTGTIYGGDDSIQGGARSDGQIGDVIYFQAGILHGGKDTLFGGEENDVLIGDAQMGEFIPGRGSKVYGGDDFLSGDAGNDTMVGDTYRMTSGRVEGGNDTIVGGAGNDEIFGDVNGRVSEWLYAPGIAVCGDDVLYGGAGNDRIFGDTYEFSSADDPTSVAQGNDRLFGGDGDDVLGVSGFGVHGTKSRTTLLGEDTLDGGLGDDQLFGSNGKETASFAEVAQAVEVFLTNPDYGSATGQGNDTLLHIENVEGSQLGDLITGSSEANGLDGGSGDDSLNGGDGKDVLSGGAGRDVFSDGRGADRFVFATAADSLPDEQNRDRIIDFSTEDRIDLSLIDADKTKRGLQHATLSPDAVLSTGEFGLQKVGRDAIFLLNTDKDAPPEMASPSVEPTTTPLAT